MRRAHRQRGGHPRSPAGYTVVEVIMALAVLTLGAAGVIAMQKATLISNTNARNLATANLIAQGWVEKLRVDSQSWTEFAGIPNISSTKWVSAALTAGGWYTPDQASAATSPIGAPQADIMGDDVYGSDTSAPAYCTQVRLTRFTSSPATCIGTALASGDPNLCGLYRMIRVEVRVFWDKSVRQLDCSAALPTDYTLGRYGFVYLVSGLLENNSPM